MSEYKVKLEARVLGLFLNQKFTGLEVYEAQSAKEAINLAKEELRIELKKHAIDLDELEFSITDVEKL